MSIVPSTPVAVRPPSSPSADVAARLGLNDSWVPVATLREGDSSDPARDTLMYVDAADVSAAGPDRSAAVDAARAASASARAGFGSGQLHEWVSPVVAVLQAADGAWYVGQVAQESTGKQEVFLRKGNGIPADVQAAVVHNPALKMLVTAVDTIDLDTQPHQPWVQPS